MTMQCKICLNDDSLDAGLDLSESHACLSNCAIIRDIAIEQPSVGESDWSVQTYLARIHDTSGIESVLEQLHDGNSASSKLGSEIPLRQCFKQYAQHRPFSRQTRFPTPTPCSPARRCQSSLMERKGRRYTARRAFQLDSPLHHLDLPISQVLDSFFSKKDVPGERPHRSSQTLLAVSG